MANLATTYSIQGGWDEAEQLEVQVMNMRKKLLGTEHPDTLTSMANLAITYSSQERWNEAEQLEVQVMDMRKRLLSTEHPDTVTSMANLATTYSSQKRWDEAEQLMVQVMEIRKKLLGTEHPDTLTSIANLNLASTYRKQDEAEHLGVQVMNMRKKLPDAEHPDTIVSIANTYHDQGKLDEAGIQVMEMRKKLHGAELPDTLTSIANLNLESTYMKQGRWKEAEHLGVQVTNMRKKLLDAEYPDTIASIVNTYKDQEKLDEVEQQEVQIMEMRKKLLGPEHPDTLTSMAKLADIYRNQAEQLEVQVMEMRKKLLGPEYPDTLTSMSVVAAIPQQDVHADVATSVKLKKGTSNAQADSASESESDSWTGTTCWISAEHALQHTRNNISSVSEIFEKWKIQKSEYIVLAGFDESLIKSGVGYLEQIHVFVTTEVDSTSPLLSELGRLFSPFSSILFTESSSYHLPVFKDDGNIWKFDDLVYFTASKFADGGSSAKTPLTIINLSKNSSLADSTTSFSQSTGDSGNGEGEKNMKKRLEKGKERDMGDKDKADEDDSDKDPPDNPEDPPGDQDGITDGKGEISFQITSGIHLNEWKNFQTLTLQGRLTIKTTPLVQSPPQFSERFVQFTKLIVGTEPTTEIQYKLFHLRVVVDSHQENADIDVIKPRGTSDSNGEEKQSSSMQSGWTHGWTAGFTLGLHPQAAFTGTAMKAKEEIVGSEKKRYLSAITEFQNDGKVRWGFNIDDVNFQKWGISNMPDHDLPTVRFEFIGDSDEPAPPPAPPPKYMDIVITSIWSIISPSEPKSTWIRKLLHLFKSTGNTQTTSYSNLFQIVALKADPSNLPELSHYRAKLKVKSGVSGPPEVKKRAADSVCVTPAVVDDLEKISNFDLPTIAKFKLSDICIPILENCNSKHSKSTRKKTQRALASRRINNGLDKTEQEIIQLAYDRLETALTNVQPWPNTEETPNKIQTEADEMAEDAWDDGCIALKVSVDPSCKALEMIKERISQFHATLKTMALDRVPVHYGFVDISMIENPTPSTIAELKEKNCVLVTKLRERFYYRDPHDMHMTDKNGIYRNSIIQYLLNSQWFAKEKSFQRSHNFDGQSMLPLVTLALILTAISFAIDVWETGEKVSCEFDRITYWPRYNKHLKKLTAWAAFSARPSSVELAGGRDICAELRKDLLCNARTHWAIIAQQVAESDTVTTEADNEAAMLAEFEADFS